MSHVVIGFFDSPSEAQEAIDKLIADGFTRENIDISSRGSNAPVDADPGEIKREKNESAITRFFKSLFNSDEEAEKYSGIALESGTVLTLYAFSEEEAARAAKILDANGAVEVDERATRYNKNRQQLGTVDNTFTSSNAPGIKDAVRSGLSNVPKEPQKRDLTTPDTSPETPRTREQNWAGIGESETGGSTQKSRIIPWKGEASARLREDRLNETKIW